MSAIEWPETPRGKLTISGAEPPLPPAIAEFQRTLREFALKLAGVEGHRHGLIHRRYPRAP